MATEEELLRNRILAERKLELSMHTLTKAMDVASNEAIDHFNVSMINLLKTSDALSDKQKEGITNNKKLVEAYKIQQSNAILAANALKKYEAAVQQGAAAQKAAKIAITKEFEDLGIDVSGYLKPKLKALGDQAAATAAVMQQASRSLTSVASKIGKRWEDSKAMLLKKVGDFATLDTAFTYFKKAATQTYNITAKLSDQGMLGAITQISESAFHFNMSADELSDLVGKNRNIINAMGGGKVGVEAFLKSLDSGKEALGLFGKEGTKMYADIMSIVNETGVSRGDTKGVDGKPSALEKNSLALAHQFNYMNKVFGDATEEFQRYYKTLLSTDYIQTKLVGLSSKAASQVLQEQMARTLTLRQMGLQNEQIEKLNATIENMYDPKKNTQSDQIIDQSMAIMTLQNQIQDAKNFGRSDIAEKLQSTLGSAIKFIQSSDDERKVMIANGTLTGTAEAAREFKAAQVQYAASTRAPNQVFQGSKEVQNGVIDLIANIGKDILEGKAAGRDVASGSKEEKDRLEYGGIKAIIGPNGTLTTELTEIGEVFKTTRNTVEAFNAAMQTPLAQALAGVTALSAAAISQVLGGFVAGVGIKSLLSSVASMLGFGSAAAAGAAATGAAAVAAEAGAASVAAAAASGTAATGAAVTGTAAVTTITSAVATGLASITALISVPLAAVGGLAIVAKKQNDDRLADKNQMSKELTETLETLNRIEQLAAKDPDSIAGNQSSVNRAKKAVEVARKRLANAQDKEVSYGNESRQAPMGVANEYGNEGMTGKVFTSAISSVGVTTPSIPGTTASSKVTPPTPGSTGVSKRSAVSDMIGNVEAGKRGYNAYNKGKAGDSQGQDIDLSTLTLGEVLRRQSLPKDDPNRLFAVGKYQITPPLMKDIMRSAKLDKSSMFTPELQEQLFDNIINVQRPKIGNYLSGKSDDLNGAMDQFSSTWMAFKGSNDKGAWDGIAGNKATVNRDTLATAFGKDRLSMPSYADRAAGASYASNDPTSTTSNGSRLVTPGQGSGEMLTETQVQTGILNRTYDAIVDLKNALVRPFPTGIQTMTKAQAAKAMG